MDAKHVLRALHVRPHYGLLPYVDLNSWIRLIDYAT